MENLDISKHSGRPACLVSVVDHVDGLAGPVHADHLLGAAGPVLHEPEVRGPAVQAAGHHLALQLLLVHVALHKQRY